MWFLNSLLFIIAKGHVKYLLINGRRVSKVGKNFDFEGMYISTYIRRGFMYFETNVLENRQCSKSVKIVP